jgi:CRISPR/Cas system CSM-associated protein Csm2 small subunit
LWSDAAFWFWRSNTDLELLDMLERDADAIRGRMTTDYVTLTVLLGEKRTPPTDEARKRLTEIIKRPNPHLVAAATVLQSQGFTATVSRGVITELDRATNRRKRDHQVFNRVREATGWLAEALGRDQKWANDFYRVVSEQRDRLERESALGRDENEQR